MSVTTPRAQQRIASVVPVSTHCTSLGGIGGALVVLGSLFGCSPEADSNDPAWVVPSEESTTAIGASESSAALPTSNATQVASTTSPVGVAPPSTTGGQDQTSSGEVGQTTSEPPQSCTAPEPGRSPLRRLTRFEYSNTIEALLNDTSKPGNDLPAELLGNGFGNDADDQPSSAFLIEQYAGVAATVVANATSQTWAKYDACVEQAAPNEQECASSFIGKFLPAAYRRPVSDAEVEEYLALQGALREHGDFKSSISRTVETILQSPDFLYRVEFGEPGATGPKRLTGAEMATRLAYFFWGAPPDEELTQAAANGELSTAQGVQLQAERLLKDPKAQRVVQFFFESLLPVNGLSDQTRDPETFPTFNPRVGNLMAEETRRFLQHAVFEEEGSWDAILTAPYTFVNETLANFYGIPGVTGDEFRKVELDQTKRLGLLTHASVLTGTTVSNHTNPVRRGGFLLSHILCVKVPVPPAELAEQVKPPEPYSGKTGRERYSIHSSEAACRSCHTLLDPPGFALENYDAVGLWRDTENDVLIDASGELSGLGSFEGPTQLVRLIAQSDMTHRCFTQHWQTFAYGREIDKSGDKCSSQQVDEAFTRSGHNVKELLLNITQTDAFMYLGAQE